MSLGGWNVQMECHISRWMEFADEVSNFEVDGICRWNVMSLNGWNLQIECHVSRWMEFADGVSCL